MDLRPTRPWLLVALAALAAAVGFAASQLVSAFTDRSLSVPFTMPVVMALLALATALWARGTRARLARRPGTRPMEPIVAARSAALAMAASRVGAVVAGFYVGVALDLLSGWDVPGVRERVITAAVTVVMGVLLVLAGLWLERICRLPDDPLPPEDDEDPTV
ncbi:MAG TPA: DUF3180 domain-containing protein [Candidatus Nanopelagicales bacterium]|nr:DUF3180 domain-containing protein [Candidatus Nanopelagicales bacterium]